MCCLVCVVMFNVIYVFHVLLMYVCAKNMVLVCVRASQSVVILLTVIALRFAYVMCVGCVLLPNIIFVLCFAIRECVPNYGICFMLCVPKWGCIACCDCVCCIGWVWVVVCNYKYFFNKQKKSVISNFFLFLLCFGVIIFDKHRSDLPDAVILRTSQSGAAIVKNHRFFFYVFDTCDGENFFFRVVCESRLVVFFIFFHFFHRVLFLYIIKKKKIRQQTSSILAFSM